MKYNEMIYLTYVSNLIILLTYCNTLKHISIFMLVIVAYYYHCDYFCIVLKT